MSCAGVGMLKASRLGKQITVHRITAHPFLFRPITVLTAALLAAVLFAALVGLLFDGARRWFLLYYFVPITIPFVAFLFERLERFPTIPMTAWGIDLLVLIPALTRAFVRLPLISGHALFLTYALMSCRSVVARIAAFLVLLQVAYLKIYVTHDTALIGGVVFGYLAAIVYRRVLSAQENGSVER